MKRSECIAKHFRAVFLNGYWIANTNYKDQLLSITWQQAIHQIADLNTIAALTYHINYYLAGILNVLKGGPLEVKDEYSFDLPQIQSEADWKKLVEDFLVNSAVFADEVAQIP